MILRTPSQLFKCLDEEQIEDLKSRQHPFYLENVELLARLKEGIDEEEEANTRFTIFEDMVEGYLYLNKGNYQVNFISATGHDMQNIFEVSTEDASETFRTPQASEWVTLLNQIAEVE